MIKFDFTLLNPNPIATIFIRIIDEYQAEHLLRTPLRISPSMWDEEKQRPLNIYKKKFKELNRKLDRLKIRISEYLNNRAETTRLSCYKLQQIIKENSVDTKSGYPKESLLNHIDAYINNRAHLISPATIKRYMVFLHLLERFEGHRKRHLYLDEVNGEFIREFLDFGSMEEYCKSTIHRTIYFIRTILNFLEKRGIRTFVYELELPKEKRSNLFVTLNEDEIIKIKSAEMPENLKAARDWLVISCYTGQRVSDFMNFNIENMEIIHGRPCMSFVQQKTQKEILLPLHPATLNILNKNANTFPRKLATNIYNSQIKEVVRLAGINNLVKVRKRKGFRGIEMLVQKWEAAVSHIGRRSFASNFYGKIPTALLMEATGHSTEQMFHRYICTVDTERTRSLGEYFEEAYKDKFLVA